MTSPSKSRGRRVTRWALAAVLMVSTLLLLVSMRGHWVEWDREGRHAKFFGGAMEYDVPTGTLRIARAKIQAESDYHQFAGRLESKSTPERVRLSFRTAKIELAPAVDNVLSWSCNLAGKDRGEERRAADELHLNLSATHAARCGLRVPPGLVVRLEGNSGEIVVRSPHFPLETQLTSGQVEFLPAAGERYRYEFELRNGVSDRFESSADLSALPIRISLGRGNVKRL